MKLIFIYGPPAVGKLTVAKELSKLTGYNLFHNHLVFDLVTSIFEWSYDGIKKFHEEICLMVLKKAVETDLEGLIFTHVFRGSKFDSLPKNIIELSKEKGFDIYFINLTSAIPILKNRVVEEDRRKYNKARKPEVIDKMFKKYNLHEKIRHKNLLSIDNSLKSPQDVAKEIYKFVIL